MEQEIYIGNSKLELGEEIVSRTLQVNDFAEIQNRQSNFSKSIKIPKTYKNSYILSRLGFVGNTSTFPYIVNTVKYVLSGIELFNGGKMVLKSTDENYYNAVIYDGNISMSSLFGSDTLADLNFSSYNHNLTLQVYFDSFSNSGGYIYGCPNIGLSLSDTLNGGTLSTSTPSFYIHTLFNMIFSERGWSISGDILSDQNFLSRTTTMDEGFDNTLVVSQTTVSSGNDDTTYDEESPTQNSGQFGISSYFATSTGVHKIEVSGSVNNTYGNSRFAVYIDRLFGGYISSVDGTIFSDVSVYALSGQEIEIALDWSGSFDGSGATNVYKWEARAVIVYTIKKDNSYFDINFEDIIGSTKQIDFVKDVMQRFNLSFNKKRNEDEFEFIQAGTFLEDLSNAEDWSEKFVQKKNESYALSYGQTNTVKYIYDDSGNDFADGKFNLANVNLVDSKVLFTTLFKASVLVENKYTLAYWNEAEEPKQDGLRIFKPYTATVEFFEIKINKDEPQIRVSNRATNQLSIKCFTFAELSYQDEIDDSYTEFISVLGKYKSIKLDVNLSIIDIYQLDFFKLKYFSQLGAYFYLNKVSGFKGNSITEIELIQIPI